MIRGILIRGFFSLAISMRAVSPLLCSLVSISFLIPPAAVGQPEVPTIRVESSEVLVPTLVEEPSGEVVYGLGPGDFQLTDNGVPQAIHVDDDLDNEPISLVIAMQKGRMAALEFDKTDHLAPLLDLFLGDGKSEAALVTFDSKAHTTVDFTTDTDEIGHALRGMEPGDGGAAVLDAIGYSVDLLESQPKNYRRVLLLISETRDHGSRNEDAPRLVEKIGTSNTLVLSVAFSPSKALLLNDMKHGAQNASIGDLITPLAMAIQAVRKNVAAEIARMSGGEYTPFTTERAFESRILEVSKHARNRYLLSFRPTDRTPGLHVLDVRLTRDYRARVVARESYWALPSTASQSTRKSP